MIPYVQLPLNTLTLKYLYIAIPFCQVINILKAIKAVYFKISSTINPLFR
jgi:hypothetical protein